MGIMKCEPKYGPPEADSLQPVYVPPQDVLDAERLEQRLAALEAAVPPKPKLFKLTVHMPDGGRLGPGQRQKFHEYWRALTADTELEGSKILPCDGTVDITTLDGQQVLQEAAEYLRESGHGELAKQVGAVLREKTEAD